MSAHGTEVSATTKSLQGLVAGFERVTDTVSTWGAQFCGYAMLLLMLLVFLEVVMRRGFHAPSRWNMEVVIYIQCVAFLMAMGYAEVLQSHLKVEIISRRLPKKVQYGLGIFITLLFLALSGVMVWKGWLFVVRTHAFHYKSALLMIPMWIPYMLVPLGFSVVGLQLISSLLRNPLLPTSKHSLPTQKVASTH